MEGYQKKQKHEDERKCIVLSCVITKCDMPNSESFKQKLLTDMDLIQCPHCKNAGVLMMEKCPNCGK